MARTESDLREAIANCESILDAGATTVTEDGHTTVFDLEATKRRLRDLNKQLDKLLNKGSRRPFFNNVDLRD